MGKDGLRPWGRLRGLGLQGGSWEGASEREGRPWGKGRCSGTEGESGLEALPLGRGATRRHRPTEGFQGGSRRHFSVLSVGTVSQVQRAQFNYVQLVW